MIVLTGGGTGGHLSIVKSLKEELNKRKIKPMFIGSTYGQDKTWFENDNGFSKKNFFDTSGVVNKNKLGKILSLSKILFYALSCYFIFKKYKVTKVISVGGYSAAPASFGAILFKKKLYIHEQNAKIGTLNKKLFPYAKNIFSSYISDSLVKDYPVNNIFFKLSRTREEIKTIIFLGGSQGANFINNLAMKLTPFLLDKKIKIIHQCGKKEYKKIKNFYDKYGYNVELYSFTNNLPSLLNKADLAISRSGASTLWELCANNLPTIFIPFPYAAKDHQYHNAKFLLDKKLCFLLRQNKLTENKILDIIQTANIKNMSLGLKTIINPNGAKKIIDIVLSD